MSRPAPTDGEAYRAYALSGPSTMPDPLCVVHQGRRARGPKPPPLGEGCICDGSGRTCPRHGVVL